MELKETITIIQIVASILLVIAILLQNRGEGLGGLFGGGGGEVFRTRRGMENLLYYITIGLAAAIVVLSLYNTTLS